MPPDAPHSRPAPLASIELTARPSGDTDPIAELIAQEFHAEYENAAPRFQYETRAESAVPWSQAPRENRLLMIHVVQHLLTRGFFKANVLNPERAVETMARERAFRGEK